MQESNLGHKHHAPFIIFSKKICDDLGPIVGHKKVLSKL